MTDLQKKYDDLEEKYNDLKDELEEANQRNELLLDNIDYLEDKKEDLI